MITEALSLERETRFEKKQIESLVPCPIIHGIAHLNLEMNCESLAWCAQGPQRD